MITNCAIDWNDRFWSKVCPEPNSGCWLWSAGTDKDGYGIYTVRHHFSQRSHRVAYERCVRAIPEAQFVLHKCDTPPCCNPDHLELGTAKKNMRDCIKRGRHRVASGDKHGLRLHPERQGMSKLQSQDVINIRNLSLEGLFQREIAKKYGVARSLISMIINRKIWCHV